MELEKKVDSVKETVKSELKPVKEKKTRIIHDEKKQKEKEQMERDIRMVRGIFRCEEERGGTITFHFKKYKDIPLKRYTFTDGESYEVPLMVAEHLAQNCWYPVHSYQVDKDGRKTQMIGRKVKRYDFVSSDFIPLSNENYKRIVTVEAV